MSVTKDKAKEQFKKYEGIHKSMDEQTNTLAALVLTTPEKQSTAPKSVQASGTALQQVEDDSDDVIYTNHFPCSFSLDLTFYHREKRRQFVSDILFAKTIHATAVCWYDEGSCMYSTTNFKDKLPIIYEKEEQGYQRRLTINGPTTTSGTNYLDQSSIRIIETLIKQVLKQQFKVVGSVFYRWDEEADQDGPYNLLTGFKLAMCLTESGPTLNVDTTITRFYPHLDLLAFILERLLKNESSFRGSLLDRHYDQIGNRLKDVEVTTAQSNYEKIYILTGYFSDQLPEKTPIKEQGNLLNYYKHLGFELRYPQLYCVKAYPLGNPQNLVDLPIELCCLREWQQVKEDENTKPVPAPTVDKRYHSILTAIRYCNFHDDELCKEIQLEVNCQTMMGIPYETLSKRQIILGRQGAFTNPVSIDNMAFIYLAERQQPNARQIQEKLLNNFYDLSGENKQVAQLQTSIKTMFIGADVQHTKNNYSGELPSIAAVVASMNSECTLTNQRVSRQWPSKGKQSEEAILLLKEMVEELLIAFKNSNEGSLPEHIVFYRDGVDDGQFERVQDDEVAALRKAFQGKKQFFFSS
ncbi:unnamed protein product [Rotaria sp. Silwood1]|nr:unnamed protein product [Rotaria sp. Silwood1]